jgi:protease I
MKTIAILVEELYQDQEVWYPYFRLQEEGYKPVAVGTGRAPVYRSKHGYEIKEEMSISDAMKKSFDAVIIPGGYAPDILRRYDDVNRFVARLFKEGKVVASICHGGWVLVSAGILNGRSVTSFFAIKDDLVNAGARFMDEEVVVDGNLITSRKPEDLPAFMKTVIKALKSM